jgi:hypothetical protein
MSMTQILIGLGGIAVAGALYYMIKEDKTPKEMAKDAKRAAKRELNYAEDKAKSAKDKVLKFLK